MRNGELKAAILVELMKGPRTARAIAEDTGLPLYSVKAKLSAEAKAKRIFCKIAPELREHRLGRPPHLYSLQAA